MRERVNLMNEGKRLDPDVFSLTFVLNSEEPLVLVSWELLSYTEIEIQIQLHFNSPLLVSSGFTPDRVKLKLSRLLCLPVYEPYKLVPDDDSYKPPSIEFTLEADFPRQMAS